MREGKQRVTALYGHSVGDEKLRFLLFLALPPQRYTMVTQTGDSSLSPLQQCKATERNAEKKLDAVTFITTHWLAVVLYDTTDNNTRLETF